MASFDIVNHLDIQKIDNGINTAKRRILQRFDLKDAKIVIELDKKGKTLTVETPDEMKMKAVKQLILEGLYDQGVSPKTVDWGKEEKASLGAIRLHCKLSEGLNPDLARDIVKRIKDLDLKVRAQIQGDQVRVEAKQIDDLQKVIAMVRQVDLPTPLQFVNMKR